MRLLRELLDDIKILLEGAYHGLDSKLLELLGLLLGANDHSDLKVACIRVREQACEY